MGRFIFGALVGAGLAYLGHRKYMDLADGAIGGVEATKKILDKMYTAEPRSVSQAQPQQAN
jgi:hypothetical protein